MRAALQLPLALAAAALLPHPAAAARTPREFAELVTAALTNGRETTDMTINWEGGFQYGGAVTADGLATAAATFPGPATGKGIAVLDHYLDLYLQPPSAAGMTECGAHFAYGAANTTQVYTRVLSDCHPSQGVSRK
jgi:hypothetical protein